MHSSSAAAGKGRKGGGGGALSRGKTVNMVSSDAESIASISQNIHNLWSSPLRIVVAIFLLYQARIYAHPPISHNNSHQSKNSCSVVLCVSYFPSLVG